MIHLLKQKHPKVANEPWLKELEVTNNYRYERKFTIPDIYSLNYLEAQVKANQALFTEVFHQRKVNNIYFDSPNYKDYLDNVLGVSDRRKIRIRWYGETFGEVANPVLEFKIKKTLVGDKWSYNLASFTLDQHITAEKLQDVFKKSELPEPILEACKIVGPTLLNSYQRRYYLSADQNFRVTTDFDLLYYRIESRFNNFSIKPAEDENKIIELKYGLEWDKKAHDISTQFPFRLNKNSKYVNGVNTIKHVPQ